MHYQVVMQAKKTNQLLQRIENQKYTFGVVDTCLYVSSEIAVEYHIHYYMYEYCHHVYVSEVSCVSKVYEHRILNKKFLISMTTSSLIIIPVLVLLSLRSTSWLGHDNLVYPKYSTGCSCSKFDSPKFI